MRANKVFSSREAIAVAISQHKPQFFTGVQFDWIRFVVGVSECVWVNADRCFPNNFVPAFLAAFPAAGYVVV